MIKRTATFNAPAEKVFSCLDDLGVTGMHMTSSSAMRMGAEKWVEGAVWETIREAQMIIYSWYRMHLLVYPKVHTTQAE